MMPLKKLLLWFIILLLSGFFISLVSALRTDSGADFWYDNFNVPDNDTVGNGWSETGGVITITDEALSLVYTTTAIATIVLSGDVAYNPVSFIFNVSTVSSGSIRLENDNNLIINFRLGNTNCEYWNGDWFSLQACSVDTTYNITYNLNYGADTVDMYIDGVLRGNDIAFFSSQTYSDSWEIAMAASGTFLIDLAHFGDLPPPSVSLSITNSTLNMTSEGGCIAWRTDKTTLCDTTDGTPTVTFDTSIVSNCSMKTTAHDYNVSSICSTTGSTSHICTLINVDKLSFGLSNLHLACNTTTETDQSGAMSINMTAGDGAGLIDCIKEIGAGCGVTIEDNCAVIRI